MSKVDDILEEKNPAFDAWLYSTKCDGLIGGPRAADYPIVSGIFYAVCKEDREKFGQITAALKLAFEAGQRSSRTLN